MKYYSSNNKDYLADAKEAVLSGLAPDGGLFMPTALPKLSTDFIEALPKLSFQEIALEISKEFLSPDIPISELQSIVEQAFSFDLPLAEVEDGTYVLELFHGPTLAFKDFGARFMARTMSYFNNSSSNKVCVLVATSGDTGGAVASGFHNVPGFEVVLLYPSGQVSKIQEQQLTTLDGNITALEIFGTFDDCQAMVKQAFVDQDLKERLTLTSANSINIARLIPQSFYYFYSYARLKSAGKSLVFSVPSGNFGNLTAGLFAKRMGLPISKFIASTNINDVVPQYLEHGIFEARPSLSTISNAMDVGNPSNFSRMLELYDNDVTAMKKDITGFSFSDEETKKCLLEVLDRTDYLLEPHAAVGYLGLENYHKGLQQNEGASFENRIGVILGTAHPAKFVEVMKPLVAEKLEIPNRLQELLAREKKSHQLQAEFSNFKNFLMERTSR